MQRRYLVVPGMRSSRIHILDTSPTRGSRARQGDRSRRSAAKDRLQPAAHRALRPDGIYINALGDADGNGPGGIFVLDPRPSRSRAAGSATRAAVPRLRLLVAPRARHDDHQRVGHAEHGGDGVNPELLLAASTATRCTSGICTAGALQTLDSAPRQQMVLELRPAHNPNETYGFVGVVTSLKDLSPRSGCGTARAERRHVAHPQGDRDPAEPRRADDLPPLLKGFGACRRSSPTSTCRSTIASSTSRASAPAS
jgi:selenium-binding protein 1